MSHLPTPPSSDATGRVGSVSPGGAASGQPQGQADGPGESAAYAGHGGDDAPFEPAPLTPRAITLAASTVLTTLLVAIAALLPAPYAITAPGPTLDTLGDYQDTDLITIEGAPTFESTGELRLTTVAVAGGVRNPVNVMGVVRGWLDRSRAVRPVEEVLPQDQTPEELDERSQAAMISSQEHATVAALEELGYEVPTTLHIEQSVEGTGAFGVIEPGDVLVAVDGEPLSGFSELSRLLDEVEPGSDVVVTVERDGVREDVTVTTTDDGRGRALLGVLVDPDFDLPLDVTIAIEHIGGPSAGLMFALGIVDLLTEPDETGGVHIAGTGTMDLTGAVGPIGGVEQKMIGAQRDGAEWFLAPVANCPGVVGRVPSGLGVAAVDTLTEARAAVEAIGRGEGEGLRTCEDVLAQAPAA